MKKISSRDLYSQNIGREKDQLEQIKASDLEKYRNRLKLAKETIKKLDDQIKTLNKQIDEYQKKYDELYAEVNSEPKRSIFDNSLVNQPRDALICARSYDKLRYYQTQIKPSNFLQIKINMDSQISKDKYIQFLEDFSDYKCSEVNNLLNKFIGHINGSCPKPKELHTYHELREENSRLKSEIETIKILINQFVAKHRETKAARRTRELEELAIMRSNYEQHNLDFCLFIADQFKDIINIPYDIDEKNIRNMIKQVAKLVPKDSRIKSTD